MVLHGQQLFGENISMKEIFKLEFETLVPVASHSSTKSIRFLLGQYTKASDTCSKRLPFIVMDRKWRDGYNIVHRTRTENTPLREILKFILLGQCYAKAACEMDNI